MCVCSPPSTVYSCSADGTVLAWNASSLQVTGRFQVRGGGLSAIRLHSGRLWCCKCPGPGPCPARPGRGHAFPSASNGASECRFLLCAPAPHIPSECAAARCPTPSRAPFPFLLPLPEPLPLSLPLPSLCPSPVLLPLSLPFLLPVPLPLRVPLPLSLPLPHCPSPSHCPSPPALALAPGAVAAPPQPSWPHPLCADVCGPKQALRRGGQVVMGRCRRLRRGFCIYEHHTTKVACALKASLACARSHA